MRNDTPSNPITMTENDLNESPGIPLAVTIVERKSVKKVKLRIKPVITPSGRAFPLSFPPIVEESTIGNIGKIHGDRIVTTPAKKAKIIRRIICFYNS
jgi:hypothetical protein